MKKHLPYIIILGILAYFIWSNRQSSISSKLFIAKIESMELEYKSKLDSLNSKITVLRDSINNEKKIVQDLEQSEQNEKDKANRWQYSYSQLKKQTPKTLRDSLNNYKQREKVLLAENRSLRVALKKADSAKAIQYKTITKLETIIINKDSIISTQDEFHLKTIELYKDELKNEKKKTFWTKVGGIALIVGALLL